MANVFNCPACGEMISADVPAGRQVQCPLCSKVVAVPEDAGPMVSAAAETLPYSTAPAGVHGGPLNQGMAIAALVCGIIGMGCLPVGIVGIVLGIVALVRISRQPTRYRGTGMAIGGICTGGVGLLMVPLMISILLPLQKMQPLSLQMEQSRRTVCNANLLVIVSAMYIYASDEEDGAFPDDLNKLVQAENVTTKQLTCPSDVPGSGSYHYVPGYSIQSDPSQIIMYENLGAHGGEGGNILYQDGRVTFVKSPQFELLIDAITLPDGSPYDPDAD